jgi:diacylglycerol kinase (ATP)
MIRIMFIVNPAAGRRNGHRIARLIAGRSASLFDPVIRTTRQAGDAGIYVGQGLNDGIGLFVAVGGDGTVNDVASALINTGGTLGIIPAGSGNGLARHLGIPGQVSHAIKVLTGGVQVNMDYGIMDGHPFFCVAGTGFDAAVGHLFAGMPGRGLPVYALAALREYFRYKPLKYTLLIDGERKIRRRAFLISFANGSQYGNNAYISPGAKVDDGLLDVCILRPFRIVRSIEIVYGLFGKKLEKSGMLEIIRCREVTVKRKKPGYIHYDGEPGSTGRKFTARVIHKGLRVMVPSTRQPESVI